jgi:hypothetical protein
MEDPEFTFTVTAQEVQVIGNALSQRPFAEVNALLAKLQAQVNAQTVVPPTEE